MVSFKMLQRNDCGIYTRGDLQYCDEQFSHRSDSKTGKHRPTCTLRETSVLSWFVGQTHHVLLRSILFVKCMDHLEIACNWL